MGADIVSSVDRSYDIGERYLVLSHDVEGGVYRDDACSATQIHEVILDEYRPLSAHSPVPGEPQRAVMVSRAALAVVAALTVGGVAITRRRHRSVVAPAD